MSNGGAAAPWVLAAGSLGFWPAVLILLGIQLLLNGYLPRWGTAITWTAYGPSMLAAMFGSLFSLSPEAIKATPFRAIARVPRDGALQPARYRHLVIRA